jgi:hypothetical protein
MVEMAISDGADASLRDADLPVFEWDDTMRDAGRCMLDRYVAEIVGDGMDEMLEEMDALFVEIEAAQSLERIEELSEGYDLGGLSDEKNVEIMQDCGMMAAQSAWMTESGFFEMMMEASQ